MTKIEIVKKAAKSNGIGRHKVSRQALQLSARTILMFEAHPHLLDEYEIELPHQDNTSFTMDKMDVDGWKKLFANPCTPQTR
jgi:hypothetical protein